MEIVRYLSFYRERERERGREGGREGKRGGEKPKAKDVTGKRLIFLSFVCTLLRKILKG